MKKLTIIMSALMFAFITMPSVQASDEKIEHYEGKEFTSKKEAMKTLIETSKEMASVAASDDLDTAKMEQIHETSYTTEDAVAFLDKKDKADLSGLAEALEEVHLASEGHKADALRQDFIAYQAKLVEFLAE